MTTRIPKHLSNGRLAVHRSAAPPPDAPPPQPSKTRAWVLLVAVFLAVHVAALFSPSLLDDADAAHAQVARHIAVSGDWVTFQIDGIRYLEKAPLPYWIVALDYRLFGFNVFATHLPMALSMLGCAALAWVWARRAYGERAAFYAALGLLTCVGGFLFTRVFIPEAMLTLLTALALYCLLTGLEDRSPLKIYGMWVSLALGLLTKGLVTPVFFLAAAVPYLLLTGLWRRWRELRFFTGILLFLAIAAPWHILAGLRNPDQGHPVGNIPSAGNVHGFFYFYFVNEHLLRFLGTRYPHDYNKLPGILYWSLHLVWLGPWFPAGAGWPGVGDAAGVADASASADRANRRLLHRESPSRRPGEPRRQGQISHQNDVDFGALRVLYRRFFRFFDESGILHVSGLFSVPDSGGRRLGPS
jgi:4-amino-4-deoxy-L-arabinose transferase-like glycosyltransferase